MLKLLTTITTAAALLAGPAMGQIDPKIKNECMKALDFVGCVKAMTGNLDNENNSTPSTTNDYKDDLKSFWTAENCAKYPDVGKENCNNLSQASSSGDTSCPEGQQSYEYEGFLGIGKEKLGCMTPAEASAFHQQRSQAWRNVNTQQQINQMQYQQQQQQFQQQQQQYRNGQQMYWMQQQMNKPRYGF
jgi:hypothetical protein